MRSFKRLFSALLFLTLASCSVAHSGSLSGHSLTVTATAYNSVKAQTQGNPSIGAWGDHLKPGMKVIAVSRDLLRMGLKHNTRVKIDGLPGTFLVKDKMNKRWSRKIDIYMGRDIKAARSWGKRKVTIRW
ncbi:3D domain-containing protein [Mariprofundus sp. KV]|uniref:3D domain-containing protein n=1 Tax=Mariprofundus sp. KV TaxID=2608715 RepID=UPI0015A19EE2|nr:3D domain-containing protein [Mariprofundus sp. KV]